MGNRRRGPATRWAWPATAAILTMLAPPPALAAPAFVLRGDVDCCKITVNVGQPAVMHVAFRRDSTLEGMTGAEFRVSGLPESWFFASQANAAATVTIGDPMGGGANIAFPGCRSEDEVALYTVTILATSVEFDLMATVGPKSPASNPNFRCPLVTLCDAPFFTARCVEPGRVCVNPRRLDCGTPVRHRPWGAVKSLYHAAPARPGAGH